MLLLVISKTLWNININLRIESLLKISIWHSTRNPHVTPYEILYGKLKWHLRQVDINSFKISEWCYNIAPFAGTYVVMYTRTYIGICIDSNSSKKEMGTYVGNFSGGVWNVNLCGIPRRSHIGSYTWFSSRTLFRTHKSWLIAPIRICLTWNKIHIEPTFIKPQIV